MFLFYLQLFSLFFISFFVDLLLFSFKYRNKYQKNSNQNKDYTASNLLFIILSIIEIRWNWIRIHPWMNIHIESRIQFISQTITIVWWVQRIIKIANFISQTLTYVRWLQRIIMLLTIVQPLLISCYGCLIPIIFKWFYDES